VGTGRAGRPGLAAQSWSHGGKPRGDPGRCRSAHGQIVVCGGAKARAIRRFYADARKLEQYARARVTQKMAS
jgi:hypothetical protein